MTLDWKKILPTKAFRVALGSIVLLLLVLAFAAGKGCGSCNGCGCTRVQPHPSGIDAGPGEAIITQNLADAETQARVEIAKINAAHDQEIAAFTVAQETEYRNVEARGPEALSAWFSDFNHSLRDAGTKR
jgi:hypothetical protein